MSKKFDFSGYVTKYNIRCSDGRTIKPNAFKHQDGAKIPLVWQHFKKDPSNVLGHVILEHRDDGVYGYATFNDTPSAQNAKALVKHKDIEALSIHANQLRQVVSDVLHGVIREASLVMAGANPGAHIDNIAIEHADGSDYVDESEAVIYHGESDIQEGGEIEHQEGGSGETIGDVFNTLDEKQKTAVYAIMSHAVDAVAGKDGDMKQSDDSEGVTGDADDSEKDLNHDEGGEGMKKNVFDKKDEKELKHSKTELTHEDVVNIFKSARESGSLKKAFLEHAGTYGIDNIDYLFPDAQKIRNTPDFEKRVTEWVSGVISGTHKSPFSRIKSMSADITADEARAKGYTTGNEKTDEVFALSKRVTTPTTIYKKQKLDRDDIIDITDMEVVAWLKMEMRMMLDEEIARAILVGDGRAVDHDNKINESNIRPIYKDADFYNHKIQLASDADTNDMIDAILRARKNYKGSGRPTFYTTADTLTDLLLLKDTTGHRLYKTEAEVAAALRVSKIVEVEVMENQTREDGDDTYDLIGIIVNLKDYTVGADKGGKISTFDDFDIDFNQYKYLMEGRMSGCLTKPKSAMTVEKLQAAG